MKNFILTIISIFMVSGLLFAQPVKICDDGAEWPPYAYHPRVDGKPDKSRVEGAAIELFDEVFKMAGLEYTIQLISWKRCLSEVEKYGKRKKYEVFSNGSYNDERIEKYYLTPSIYETHKGIFYSTTKFPNGPPIKSYKDLTNFKLCGVFGFGYGDYYLEPSMLDTGSRDIKAVLKKISKGRCDLFPNSIEPVYGFATIGESMIPKNIKAMVVPEFSKTTFHLFISKQSPRAQELVTKLSQAILKIRHSPKYDEIFSKYFK